MDTQLFGLTDYYSLSMCLTYYLFVFSYFNMCVSVLKQETRRIYERDLLRKFVNA